jgi:hypothetical protein
MATAIFFNGRRLNVPQAVTKIDTSGLATVSPAAVGIIALVGTAEGGKPLTIEESEADATRPSKILERYHGGDLRTAGIFAFEPSADEAIPGGAQKVIGVKVNPATQSGISLPDGNGADAIDITSKDYGLRENQVNIEVGSGTTKGKKLTVVFEDTAEVFDDTGGDSLFDAIYAPDSEGYGTMLGSIDASAFVAAATKAKTGLSAERTNDIPAPGVFDAVSSAAGDTTQSLTVFGLDGSGNAISETKKLSGTTNVQGSTSFTKVVGCVLDGACAGTVTVSDYPITTTLFTLAPATLTRGLVVTTNTPAAGVPTVSIDSDTAVDAVLVGLSPAGAVALEAFDLTTGATTPVVGTTDFAALTYIALGDVALARTVTISIDAAKTLHASFSTVAKVVDRLNALAGFTANANIGSYTTFRMVDADYNVAPTRPAENLIGAAKDFYADLYFCANKLTSSSAFVNGAKATGGALPPANTTAPVFLIGGDEGTTTIAEWQQAFDLLKKRRYNIIVPLTRDPAVHFLALTHLIAKAGVLKSEANGYVGIGKADGSGETRSEIQSQIQALNTRHICAISQELQRFDNDTGESTWYPPYMKAVVAAGMQAGSVIGEPLTHKLLLGTDIRNDPSWSVEDDVSDLIDRGLMMSEKIDGVGIRWVRSITTHLADDNVVFVEMSANESLITAVYEFRNRMEQKIGSRGLGGTVGTLYSIGRGVLNEMVDEEKIVAHRALQIEQVGDVFPTSVQLSVVLPVNFIPITIHLTPTLAAAA